ncbi:hypothetical protein [Crucian carp herpesvirus]|uniref:ORF59 n=1 Tax=Cyprinid herpesvirus 2 TaxID=317878 RepID=K7PC23_CYHV2|nr:protein ORF59 [Cyprinid herpesvirus 2]APB92908.1 hypothetical protein [Crucian carp herpesvirus]AFJ20593.1 protein ORF59 [Cyprinid herpesvirus 2]AKC02007.1 hypothetical protein [Cyprinid herpesvirus 2]AMB21629.1 ORF59 [Cyprinid herpesvirus 2]QAU54783.1 protein ORF59 [Cyprinid herpesvirus 2]
MSQPSFSTSVYVGDLWGAPSVVSVAALVFSAATFIIVLLAITMQRYQICEEDDCNSCSKILSKSNMRRAGRGGGGGSAVIASDMYENGPDYYNQLPPAYSLGQLHSRSAIPTKS